MAMPSVSMDSDHRLLKAKIKLHEVPKSSHSKRTRMCTENIKGREEELQEKIREELITINSTTIEDLWTDFKEKIVKIEEDVIGSKVIGKGKKKRTAWWVPEVQDAVKAKQKAFRKWMKERTMEAKEEYNRLRNEASTACRRAKRNMWIKIGNDLEEDHEGQKKLMFSMAKRYRKAGGETTRNIKDKNGNSLFDQHTINKRWNEYFEELLNIAENETTQIEEHPVTVEQLEPISMEEILKALKKTKNNKSPGSDLIPIEVIKAAGQPMLEFLHKILNIAYETGQFPSEWNCSEIRTAKITEEYH